MTQKCQIRNHQICFLLAKSVSKPVMAGDPPRTLLGELTTLARPPRRLRRGYPLPMQAMPLWSFARRLRRLELGAYSTTRPGLEYSHRELLSIHVAEVRFCALCICGYIG